MELTINAYSTALYATWINVEELNLLVDAGDGLSAGLLQKTGKVKHIFITHADRDHINGLLQFLQLHSREGHPQIYYPKDSNSFKALANFQQKFDSFATGSVWTGIKDGSEIAIKKTIEVHAMRNEHYPFPQGVHKTLSYKAFEIKHKLKQELLPLDGKEIKEIADTYGKDRITDKILTPIISFSGDTPVDDYSKWDHSNILIHEATFIKEEDDPKADYRANKHSRLDEVLKMVSEIEVNTLILNHFSIRYTHGEIIEAIRKMCKEYKVQIPVYAILPGEVKMDILSGEAVN